MNARQVVVVAIKVLGICFLLSGICAFPQYAVAYHGLFSAGTVSRQSLVSFWGTLAFFSDPALLIVLGVALLMYAPAISRRLDRGESEPAGPGTLTAEALLRIGIQLLGVYALMMAIRPLSGAATGFLIAARDQSETTGYWDKNNLLTGLACIGSGLILVLKGGWISGVLSRQSTDEPPVK